MILRKYSTIRYDGIYYDQPKNCKTNDIISRFRNDPENIEIRMELLENFNIKDPDVYKIITLPHDIVSLVCDIDTDYSVVKDLYTQLTS